VYEITINQTLDEGWYWFAFNVQSAATTNTFAVHSGVIWNGPASLVRTGSNGQAQQRWQQTGVTGAFNTAGTLSSNTQTQVTLLRKT